MPEDITEKLKNLTPEQTEIASKFKDLATASNPQEKQMAFLKLFAFLKSKKPGVGGELGDVGSMIGMSGGEPQIGGV